MVDERHTHEVDDALLELLVVEEDPARTAAGRAVARARLGDAMLDRRPRRRRRAWLVPAVAALTLVGGGAAIAQTTGLADRILGSDRPAAERIGSLRDDTAPGMTEAELRELFDTGSMRSAVGDRIQGDDGVIGASIVDDRGGVRVGAIRTNRNQLAVVTWRLERGRWSQSSIAGMGFLEGWPITEGISRSELGRYYSGVAADGVERITFLADGVRDDAVLAHGTYLYWPRDDRDRDAVEVELADGTVVRRSLRAENESWASFLDQMEAMDRCTFGDDNSFEGTPVEMRRQRQRCHELHANSGKPLKSATPEIISGPTG